MDATLELTHERVDDVPLLLGSLIKLPLPEILDRHFPPHPLHPGLSDGWLITAWIAYILSRADHRKSLVQAWAEELHHSLETPGYRCGSRRKISSEAVDYRRVSSRVSPAVPVRSSRSVSAPQPAS